MIQWNNMEFTRFYNFLYICKDGIVRSAVNIGGLLCVKIYLSLSAIFNAMMWLSVYYISTRTGDGLVVLHYNVDFGVDLMGNVERLYIMPGIGSGVLLINVLLLLFLYERSDIGFLSHFLLGSALIVNIVLLVSLGPIYLVNFVY